MFEDRLYRVSVPALVLLFELFGAAVIDPNISVLSFIELSAKEGALATVVAGLLAGGMATFALGHMIGAISYVVQWSLHRFRNFEPFLTPDQIGELTKSMKIKHELGDSLDNHLPIIGLFDHVVIKNRIPSIHDWIQRRWHTSVMAANSCIASFIAIGVVMYFSHQWNFTAERAFHIGYYWGIPVFLLASIFGVYSWNVRRVIKSMLMMGAEIIYHDRSYRQWKGILSRSNGRSQDDTGE